MTVGELALQRPVDRALARTSFKTALAFASVTCLLAPVAYMAMFSVFQAYDDEGYFLLTLKDYLAGHALFTQALPIYGPFFYEVMGGLFKTFGIQPSLDAGRLVTAVVWLIASLLGGVLAHRLTRNLWLGVAGQLVTFRVLATFVNEPLQPAGLTTLLLLSLMVAATFKSSRPRAVAAVAGAVVGALLLVKVNMGVFAAAAVVYAWAACLPDRWRRLALPVLVLLMAVFPLALMTPLLNREWVLELAVVATLTAAAFGVATLWRKPESRPAPSAGWMLAGGAAVLVGCLALAFAGGTHLEDWWSKSVVLATRFPEVFVWPVAVNAAYIAWAALSLLGAVAFCRKYARSAEPPSAGLLRVWAGFFMWLSMVVLPAFLLALPLAWIAALAPSDDRDNPTGAYPRLLLPALAVIGSLQIFPVAGTQLSLAALGLLPLGAISISDGIRQLRRAGAASPGAVGVANRVAPVVFGIVVAALMLFGLVTATEFAALTPLGLPGAQSVRLSDAKAAQLRSLVGVLDQDCTSFITYPGMNSFYLWTGQAPPAEVSSEVWWLVLQSPQQQGLVDQLRSKPRLCVVKNRRVLDFWAEGRQVPSRPLVQWIDNNFVQAGSYGDYELLVPRSS